MSAPWVTRGGHLIVFWRSFQEVGPLLKGYVRLARAETALAAGSFRGVGVALALASTGVFITLIALIGALMAWLIQSGMPIWEALLWVALPSIAVAMIGLVGVIRRYELLTLPQTRKRVRMLLELIDEER